MSADPKTKRRRGLDEPPLGFGRDIEIHYPRLVEGRARAAVLLVGLGIFFGLVGASMPADRPGFVVELGGGALIVIALYFLAVLFRNRGRDDLFLRIDHRTFDCPLINLAGPMRLTRGLHELAGVRLMRGRQTMWIEVEPLQGPTATLASAQVGSLMEMYWRLELRITLARRFGGRAPRVALVGAEAMVALGRTDAPIAGVVLSRTTSKRPVVIATVKTLDEFLSRFAEWPADAKLSVPEDATAQLPAAPR